MSLTYWWKKKERQFSRNRVTRGRIIFDEFRDVDKGQILIRKTLIRSLNFIQSAIPHPFKLALIPLIYLWIYFRTITLLYQQSSQLKIKNQDITEIIHRNINNKIFSAKQKFNLPEKPSHYFNQVYILGFYKSNEKRIYISPSPHLHTYLYLVPWTFSCLRLLWVKYLPPETNPSTCASMPTTSLINIITPNILSSLFCTSIFAFL